MSIYSGLNYAILILYQFPLMYAFMLSVILNITDILNLSMHSYFFLSLEKY